MAADTAEYNVVTRKVRNARLLEFVEYASDIDERQLERLSRRGAEAWKGVGDATAWVDELRGGEDRTVFCSIPAS